MVNINRMRVLAWILSAGLAAGSVHANVPVLAAAQGATAETAAKAPSAEQEKDGKEETGKESGKDPSAEKENNTGSTAGDAKTAGDPQAADGEKPAGTDNTDTSKTADLQKQESEKSTGKSGDATQPSGPAKKGAAENTDAADAEGPEKTGKPGVTNETDAAGSSAVPKDRSDKTAKDDSSKAASKEEAKEKEAEAKDGDGSGDSQKKGTEEKEKAAPGGIRFRIKGSGETLGKDDVSFDKKSTGYKDGQFLFDDSSAGDKVKYTVKKDGYREADGEAALKESSQTIEVSLEKETKDESISILATYGDGPISLSQKLEDAGYGSGGSCSIESGKDVISVSDDGIAVIKKAGSASIKAETGNGTVTFKITVGKLGLGQLSSGDVEWEGTRREEDGTKKFTLSGAVKKSAGLIGSDSVTVTADAEAESEKPGTWGTALANIQFQGAGNYELTLSGDGPEVTITKKTEDISITATYGDGPIDLSKELEDAGYGSGGNCSIESGEDVISVSGDGMAVIKKAGSASVKAETEAGTVTVKVTVNRLNLGSLAASDIEWTGTEREKDGTKMFALSGTVKKSAGLIGGDSVTVTADAEAESEKPGTWGTALANIQFQGAGSYELTLSGDGPEVTITKKTEDISITATYGDGPISLSQRLEDAGYGSGGSYSIEGGEDVISVSGDGMAVIKKAGEASVKAEDDEGIITFNITVGKLSLGQLSSGDIDWEGTVRKEDGTKKFTLSGTVKESAGLIGGDSITVTADGEAASERPGKWGTSLSNIKFQGADSYMLTLSDNGPEVTIKEEISIAGTYSGSARNGKYFKDKRTLTVSVAGDDFEEGRLTFHLSIDGDRKDYTVNRLGSGSVEGISLEKDGERTYILAFGKEGEEHEYAASITYEDKTADITGTAKDAFAVDMAAPELSVTFADKNGNAVVPREGNAVESYAKSAVTAALSVKDGNFNKKDVKVTVKASDAQGNALSVYGGESGPSAGAWQDSGKDHSFIMDEFTEDANYLFSASVEDLAGNRAEYSAHAFGIDINAPEAELTVENAGEEKKYTEYSGSIVIGIVGQNSIRVTASASDTSSGVDRVQYHIETPEPSEEGEAAAISMDSLPSLEWEDMPEGGITVDPDGMSAVYLKVTDRAGNASYLNSKDIIIADASRPEIKIEKKGDAKRAYSGDISLRVSAREAVSGGACSGLSKVEIEVESGGKVTDTWEYVPGSLPERAEEFSAEITVDADKNNSNRVVVRARAKDAAGNEAETEKVFTIDTSAPGIEAGITNGGIKNGHYVNETAELEAIFRERNFDASAAVFSFTAGGKEHTYTMEELSEGKGRAVQVLVKSVEDSQKGVPYKDRTDAREVKYTLQLGIDAGADITYGAMRLGCTDPAGNTGKGRPGHASITVDKIAPVITASYSAGGTDVTKRVGASENAPFYTQNGVAVTFTVDDTNFAPGTAKAYVTSKDSSGKDTGVYSLGDISEGWSKNGSRFSKTIPAFSRDANYSVSMEAEDLAGNMASTYPAHFFTIDKTAPSGKIFVHSEDGDRSYSGFSENASFESVSGRAITVTHSESDSTSGIANVKYYRYTPPENISGRFTALSLGALRKAPWESWDGELTVRPDSQAIIYARIADRAGNILYISTAGAMIADRTEPWNPEIKFFEAKSGNSIYAGDVPVTISVSDREAGGTYSGLKDVTFEVLNGSSVTQRNEYHPGSKADRIKAFGTTVTVNAAKNNANNVTVRVTVRDHAGNTASSEKQISIDITDPVIEVAYDNNSPVNGKYYNKPRTATITVKERNFDPSRASLVLQDGAKASGWSIGSGAGSSDDARNTCTVTFGTDGDYAFTLSVKDKAGNSASYGKTDTFTVDMTSPVIRVAYNVDRESGFYNTARTATIHVTEHNFRPQEFEAQVKASLEGTGIAAPSVSGWGGTGDDHTATLTFARDGNYSFTLNYTDLAANRAQGFSQGVFTIDMTAPALEIAGVEDGSANRGKVMPSIRYTDLNYTDDLVIKISGTRHEERNVTGAFLRLGNGGQVSISDFPYKVSEDDIYTLTARSADKAGNVAEKAIRFSVNRFGSNFYLDGKTEEVLEAYYMQHAGSVAIYEVNVDRITDRDFTVYRDGSVISIPEDAVSIEEQDDGNGWYKYRYTIGKSAIDEEGLYEIVVNTMDAAGNRQENRTKDVPITFIVDRTPPSAAITGIEDGQTYIETARAFEVHAADDRALAKVEVYVDGELKGTYEGDQLKELGGTVAFELKEAPGWQKANAVSYDVAGNVSSEDAVKVLVTTDRLTQAVNSLPFRAALTGILLTAIPAAALAVFFYKKKKEDYLSDKE